MKRITGYLVLVVCGLCFFSPDASAQKGRKKAPVKRRNTTKKTTTTPVDTVAAVLPPVVDAPDSLSVPLPVSTPSLRSNTSARQTIDTSNGVVRKMEKTPLQYENLREDDELYKQVLWRNISVKEKMNLPFTYNAEEDNGDQRFIMIILKTIKEGINDSTPLVAFKDDRFTTPTKKGEISSLLVGKSYVIPVPDWAKDPDGSKGIMKDSTISDEFNPALVETYQVKEEVIFDRKTSRLHWRILGIAPIKKSVGEDGTVRGEFPLFWIYYPDFRPALAKFEAYNPRNAANRLSWEEVFESHYFSSYIVKSTISNNSNQMIANMIKDPILRLVESDNIKQQIFDFEQTQWSY